jgi:uncharacterized membrane protein HdeD (DUF308 family)
MSQETLADFPACPLRREFSHLRDQWCWLLLLGILMAIGGTACLAFPGLTAMTSFSVVVMLGIILMIAGIGTIITAFWAGKWSGLLVQLLIGILYLVAGISIAEHPGKSTVFLTMFLAAMFVVAGIFRVTAALVIRFPHWGWTLLNGVVTLMLGVIILRHFPEAALWLIGTLVGVDLLLQGWSWIALALAIRKLPETPKPATP